MARREITGAVAGLILLAALAGCSGTAAGPDDAQIDSATVPATVEAGNAHSDTGGCALITSAQVAAATGASIERTSNIGTGCSWSGRAPGASGQELVVSLVQTGDENGDGARVLAEQLAMQEALGSVEQVSELGQQAFSSTHSAPTVWWLQDQQVYSVAVELVPAPAGAVDTAIELAKIASGNLPD
ncbi:DUF3558 domain-containing protein [Tomitella biformata]|uniref:DUF3558 domain-containing protein n=1 Tax=Tomitella biformata TaxID=630403 RepID=UPI0004635BD4|nr:DUF3558 domain-containing protein [Tomitella biformata]